MGATVDESAGGVTGTEGPAGVSGLEGGAGGATGNERLGEGVVAVVGGVAVGGAGLGDSVDGSSVGAAMSDGGDMAGGAVDVVVGIGFADAGGVAGVVGVADGCDGLDMGATDEVEGGTDGTVSGRVEARSDEAGGAGRTGSDAGSMAAEEGGGAADGEGVEDEAGGRAVERVEDGADRTVIEGSGIVKDEVRDCKVTDGCGGGSDDGRGLDACGGSDGCKVGEVAAGVADGQVAGGQVAGGQVSDGDDNVMDVLAGRVTKRVGKENKDDAGKRVTTGQGMLAKVGEAGEARRGAAN